jgi:serine protease Do
LTDISSQNPEKESLKKEEISGVMRRFLYIFLIVVLVGLSALSGAVAGGIAVYQAVRPGQTEGVSSSLLATEILSTADAITTADADTTQKLVVTTTDIETTITQVVQEVAPAVVTVVGTIPGQATFFGRSADQTVSGSGVFISEEGFILTNNHVVEDASNLEIILSDGNRQSAEVVGTDIYADLAVLKTDQTPPAFAGLGNSDVLKPGESVIAIGSPLGDFTNSVTVGVISATGRSIDTGQGYQIEGLVQTDAAINQGNSGGPLVNLAGEVIGINTLVVRGSGTGTVAEGLGFAIPSNTARAVAEQIMEKGYFSRPYLGIRWQLVTPRVARIYNLPVEWGVYVTEVYSGSPAHVAGIQPGDIITRFGDVSLDETHSYINALFQYEAGDQVQVQLARGNQNLEVEVTLGEAREQ